MEIENIQLLHSYFVMSIVTLAIAILLNNKNRNPNYILGTILTTSIFYLSMRLFAGYIGCSKPVILCFMGSRIYTLYKDIY